MRPCVIATILVSWIVCACDRAETPPPERDPSSLRSLQSGRVIGFTDDDGAHVWRGIPFATPPTGELRWRAPRPPAPWEGVREATEFGPRCVQFAGLAGGRNGADAGDPVGSEDCLTLNVYAPRLEADAVPRGSDRLPVMFWIHGGGNSLGSAHIYPGSRLALRHDVIVVTVQYRLGVFGWFRHPALDGDSKADRSGNYGTLDLVRALEWVRDDIAAFGGDPDRITIFGESAGGGNVYSLILSPRARGLFQRAIVQSGGLWTSSLAEAENLADDTDSGHAHSSAEVLLALLQGEADIGDRNDALARLASLDRKGIDRYLRSKAAFEILRIFDGESFGGMYDAPNLIRDGWVLPEGDALQVLASGAYNQVPVITGTNRDENKLFLLFSSADVTRLFGLPLWLKNPRRYELMAEYQSRMWKATGVDEPAATMRRVQGDDVFAYRFDWDEEPKILWSDFSTLLGAAHGLEIPFVLGYLDLGFANRFLFDEKRRPAAKQLSDAMMSYWTQFAYRGRPERGRSDALPRWSPWDGAGPEASQFLVFDTDADGGIRMSDDTVTEAGLLASVETDDRFASRRERCELYVNFVLWSGRMTREDYERVADGACREYPIDDFPWSG
jgi:para-nitrobenzyl esterase